MRIESGVPHMHCFWMPPKCNGATHRPKINPQTVPRHRKVQNWSLKTFHKKLGFISCDLLVPQVNGYLIFFSENASQRSSWDIQLIGW